MGGARCAVSSCNNNYTASKKRGHVLSLHSFPKDRDLKDIWVEACSRGDPWNPETSLVCSDHFVLEDFMADQRLQLWTGVKWRPQLKPGAVPTRNLPQTKCRKYKMEHNLPREPHRRFSMFKVLSIELENRLEKAYGDNDPSEGNMEPNIGNTGHSVNSKTGAIQKESSPVQTMYCTGLNQDDVSHDSNHKTTYESSSTRLGDTDSETENDESHVTGFSSQPPKKLRISSKPHTYTKLRRTSRHWKGLSAKHINVDSCAIESQLSPVNTSIIYSCPAFELFVHAQV